MQIRYLINLLSCSLVYGGQAPFPAFLSSPGTRNDILNADLDAFVNQILVNWKSPGGVGVAVVRRDVQGTWNVETRGYGAATADGTRVNENTLFAIGSNSKLFNVVATGLLVDNETLSPRLSWDSKIASIVPTWGLLDPIASEQASIVDVMSHRTGMPRHDLMYRWSDDVPSIINKLKFLRPSAEFRDVWQYCNNHYTLLAYLPPLLLPSKTPFARYVKEHIFDPLGMASTTYSYDKALSTGQLADGMVRQGIDYTVDPFGNGTVRSLPYWSTIGGEDGNVLSGAGGVISSPVDLATWLQTLLLEGRKPGTNESVIPAQILQKVSTGITVQRSTAQFPELSPVVYGGGQARSTYRGHEIIEHSGSVPGFNSLITRLPNDNLGIAVLTNDDAYGTFTAEIIKARILDEALGLDKIDWSSRALVLGRTSPATPRPINPSLPSVDFTALAGIYHNVGYGSFELCLVSAPAPTASPSCRNLTSEIPKILPGAVNPSIPTYMVKWDSPWASHVEVTHFNGNIFNITGLSSIPTGNASEPYWTYTLSTSGFQAELAVDGRDVGVGFTGIWGAGTGVPSPTGTTVRARAEVWFDRTGSP